jgi:hypothetical protein
MPDERRKLEPRFSTWEEWDAWTNAHAVPDTDPNQTVLMGARGRPATREELEAYLTVHKVRMEPEPREAGLELDLG